VTSLSLKKNPTLVKEDGRSADQASVGEERIPRVLVP